MNNLMTTSFMNYVELKRQALRDLEGGAMGAPNAEMATGSALTRAEEDNLSLFFSEIVTIQSEMNDVSNLLLDLQSLNEDSKSAHSTKVLRGLHDRIDADVVAVLRKAKDVKARLEFLDRANVANRGVAACFSEGSPVDRTRMLVTNGLRTKLRETMNGFQQLRDRILAEHRESLKRKYFNATGEVATEEVINEMLSGSSQVKLMDGKGQVDLEVLERQKAVSDIQRSLMQLHQVFLDMALMVEAHEDQLDNIEENVARANDYISGGTDRLAVANAIKKRSRKLNFSLWSLVLVAILLFLVCFILILADS